VKAYDTIVIGGGFYGCRLALRMRQRGDRVLLVEREPTLLARASLLNQARVHNGYHYPRSILTSLRSRANYARFLAEYAECVDTSFPHYYAVARGMSKVNAAQFTEFCRRVGAPLVPAPKHVRDLFDAGRIEAVFAAEEGAFDALKLRARMERDLAASGVEVLVRRAARGVRRAASSEAQVELEEGGEILSAKLVLNCTYSSINDLLDEPVPMKYELTEMALVEPPPELLGAAVTVMDGPFFSLMPYPPRELYTLSHVRYTPHATWESPLAARRSPPAARPSPLASHYPHMLHDAMRYLPVMRSARYVDSLWETKAIMPRSDQDDSRPILLRRTGACVTVLGAKIDSVYDVEQALDDRISDLHRRTA
jgi:glycine/D-amino acid oxidase-like deaminating enzyme